MDLSREGGKRKGNGYEHEHTRAKRGTIDQRGGGGGGGCSGGAVLKRTKSKEKGAGAESGKKVSVLGCTGEH